MLTKLRFRVDPIRQTERLHSLLNYNKQQLCRYRVSVGHDPANGKELWRVGDLNHKDRYNRTR